MDQKTIIVVNWMAFMLLTPAASILARKMVSEKLNGRGFPSDLITGALVLGSAVIGVAELDIDGRVGWISWTLLVAQLILLVFLVKRLYPPLKQKLRG